MELNKLDPDYQIERPKKEKVKKVIQNKVTKSVKVYTLTKS